MQEVDISTVLGALATLTGQRDQHALDRRLCDAVEALMSPYDIQLIEARQRSGAWAWKSIATRSGDSPRRKPFALPDVTRELIGRFELGEIFPIESRSAVGKVFLAPLAASTQCLRSLLIRTDDVSPVIARLLAHVLSVYDNHLRLLNDNHNDTLTGLLNRKTFDQRIERLMLAPPSTHRRNSDRRSTACLAVLDIDHFKRINDRFGHLFGDEVLLLFARLMTETFRDDDLLFRFGGEEFVVVLRSTVVEEAVRVLERFRRRLEAYEFPQVGQVTVSIGVAAIGGQDLPGTVVDQADQALYFAKNNGRNRVCSYESLVQSGELKTTKYESDVVLF